jgi:hypothetical protein
MTENQNSNADGERPTPTPGNGQDSGTSSKSSTPGAAGQATNGADTPQSHDANDLDAAWAAFEAEHQADLHDVASSRQAKKFEKQAKKREKEALLSVDDLDIGSFTDDARPSRGGKKGKQSGPRDFTGSSWLDTDNVMDTYDDGGFTPPNPDLGPVKASTVLLTALLIIGLVGEAVMIFVSSGWASFWAWVDWWPKFSTAKTAPVIRAAITTTARGCSSRRLCGPWLPSLRLSR